jgi:xylulokinase
MRTPREDLFAGLDVSTQSTKLVVIAPERDEVVFSEKVEYDRDLPHWGTREGVVPDLGEGISESDPRMWLEAVEVLLARLRESDLPVGDIRALAVSGQQHGLVALDEDGRPARPRAKLWNDHSTTEECRLLTEAVGGREAMLREVGNTQRPGYTAPKVLHLRRHEPEAWARTALLLLPHDYVNWHLTGGPDGGVAVMEPGDASGTAMWSPLTGEWSPKVLEAIGPDVADKLPPVSPSDRTIGPIGAAMADRYGLDPACRIDAGSGDNMYAAIGTGNIRPGIVTVSLGTSGTAYTVSEEVFVDPEGEIAAFRDATGRHLPLLCVTNMANGYTAVRERYGLDHDAFEAAVGRTPPGNRGRVLIPWYEGERTPDLPSAAPLLFGFQSDDLDPDVLCRAVLEGHVLNLWSSYRRLPVEPEVVHLTGGLSRSPAWCQTIADVFEVETVPVAGEGAALGAALHAAWVWRKEAGREVTLEGICAPFVVPDEARRCRPEPAHRETYRRLKELFEALSRRIRGLPADDPFELRRRMLLTTP